ncbi:MAG TPA: hypothetical protein VMH34_03630 [Gammaproteobacteria bacterium]|nr:hypothetical protein [Gammaproteobacteria bacterium]
MNNRDQLIDLMAAHKLERRDVAELVHVTIDTVHDWLLPMESHGRVDIPDMAIELLTLKLAARGQPPV